MNISMNNDKNAIDKWFIKKSAVRTLAIEIQQRVLNVVIEYLRCAPIEVLGYRHLFADKNNTLRLIYVGGGGLKRVRHSAITILAQQKPFSLLVYSKLILFELKRRT